MKITIYDYIGRVALVMDTFGEAHVRIECDDAIVRVREADEHLLYSAENAYTDEALVHVLWGGASLCKMPGVPSTWPPNHRFVALNQEAEHGAVTCPRCKKRLDEVLPELKAMIAEHKPRSA